MNQEESGSRQAEDHNEPQDNATPTTGNAHGNDDKDCSKRIDVSANHQEPSKSPWLEYGPPVAMAAFTAGIFIATLIYAVVAARTLDEIHAQTQQSGETERPWLYLSQPQTAYNIATGSYWAVLAMKDSGQTPAFNVISRGYVYFGARAMRHIDAFFAASTLAVDSIEKSQRTIVIPNSLKSDVFKEPVARSIFEWATSGNDDVHIAVRVWYQDRLGNQYKTDFCMVWYASMRNWVDCERHNDAQ